MSGSDIQGDELPAVIPVFPLDGVILPPGGLLPLNIFEPRYLNMIDDAMAGDRIIGMVQTRSGGDRIRPELARIGGAGLITSFTETRDGRYLITLTGVCRFALGQELSAPTPYRQVRADYAAFATDLDADDETGVDREGFLQVLRLYLMKRNMDIDWDMVAEAPVGALVNGLAMALPFDVSEKQAFLEAVALKDRAHVLSVLLKIEAAGENGDGRPPLQ
jgi:uncharacterized protein